MTRRVAILISGGGSNMVALVRAMTGAYPARPVVVLANNPAAGGLARAHALDVPAICVDHRSHGADRRGFEAAMLAALEPFRPDIIALAGFMRVLGAEFLGRFPRQIVNIHPSLLPKYPGLNTHQRALASGDREAGCTVHEVTAELDAGPILGQGRVPVHAGDTAESLAARVLAMEHRLYPAVLGRFATGERRPLYLP